MQPRARSNLVVFLASAGPLLAQQVVPEVPAIHRNVTNVVQTGTYPNSSAVFLKPHQPAVRTTRDGRLGVFVEGDGGAITSPSFVLMRPETMQEPFLLGPAGTNHVAVGPFNASSFATAPSYVPAGRMVHHVCLWDENPPFDAGGSDVYDVHVFVTSLSTSGPPRVHFYVTPTRITVANPKTAQATIVKIEPVPGTTMLENTDLHFDAVGFEPIIAGDGRLLVMRVFSSQIPQTSPPLPGNNGTTIGADIVYSYYPTGAPANPKKWATLLPISHAPYDPLVNTKFGFARQPFRDASGTLIPDGTDLGGSYPWIDRDAKNLFLEGVNDTFHYGIASNFGRYGFDSFPRGSWLGFAPDDDGHHQGVTLLGLWSHGKMVQIDTLNNDMDYGMASGDQPPGYGPQWRNVHLFQPGTGVFGNETGKLLLGYGRATVRMPPMENDNANIIDSLENKLNTRSHMRPLTFRDVVWHLNNSKQSEEFAFDDYLDPDALIVANMTGLMVLPAQPTNPVDVNRMKQQSGWDRNSNSFSSQVKLQNAATAPEDRWRIPDAGIVHGPGRLEPAATGGVNGKGFWLESGIRLEFRLPTQTSTHETYARHDWYVGLFVDSRFSSDTTSRRLVTFPDGTSIRMFGRSEIHYCDGTPAQNVVARIPLPTPMSSQPAHALDDLVPQKGWAHFAFQIRRAGKDVEFLLDGLPYHRIERVTTPLFRIQAGALYLGTTTSGEAGFRGWIDDFKVIGHTVDPETACNHAGGTLIGLPQAYAGVWKTHFAARYPAWTHTSISEALAARGEAGYRHYACFHDYKKDFGAHRDTLPAGTVHLRENVHFPEGPLFHDAPRPDTRKNEFCISCHSATSLSGLNLNALTAGTGPAALDPRRQPSQPPALLHANLPVGVVQGANGSLPAAATVAPSTGQPVDPWMLPSFPGTVAVQGFTVLDGVTFAPLMQLTSGAMVDPAILGTSNLLVRANLDSAQGGLAFYYDGSYANPHPDSPYLLALGTNLQAVGSHTVNAIPSLGASSVLTFAVPQLSSTPREIAHFSTDCRAGSPLPGWVHAWNPTGVVSDPTAYAALTPASFTTPVYTTGVALPGTLTSVGGVPGRGTAQGEAADRHVVVGFRVKYAGYYALSALGVASTSTVGNGGAVLVQSTSGGVTTPAVSGTYSTSTGLVVAQHKFQLLNPGAVIWVCVGPNGDDTGDAFSLDFRIQYNETAF